MARQDVKPPQSVKRSLLNVDAIITWPGAYPTWEELPAETRQVVRAALDTAIDAVVHVLGRS